MLSIYERELGISKMVETQWRLPTGRHRLRIALHYDRGREVNDFWLDNGGPRRDDVRLQPVT